MVKTMEKQEYVAIIPVRGGSKSIPLKNIQPINGRPLVYWTIDAAVNSVKIDRVYIATDSEQIKEKVALYIQERPEAAEKVFCISRSPETATDTASTESVMIEFAQKYDFGHLVLIQATSPLLQAIHLDEGIRKYEEEGADSLLSVVRQKRFIWKDTGEGAKPQNYDYLNRPRRQEFDGYLVENGAFYVTKKEAFMNSLCRISGRIAVYEMPEETYYEIDEPSDWIVIEHLMKNRRQEKRQERIRLFVTDCDGCLTDGGMYYSETGDELKKFNTRDGMGMALLRKSGVKVAIITSETTKIVERRAKKLKVDYLYQGAADKLSLLRELAETEGISFEQIAYMGDDINDKECILHAGLSFTVPDAMEEIRQSADVITLVPGGAGAVREAAEYILKRNKE